MERFLPTHDLVPVDHDPFAGPAIARFFPTTEPQREVWLASEMGDEASCAYNESVSLRLTGPIHREHLSTAVERTVERHSSLRSVFSASGMRMLELAELRISLEHIDLSSLDPGERDRKLRELNAHWMSTPFDLANGPLFKPVLIRLAAEDHILRFIAHHSVCDGWSLGIIMADVSVIYSSLLDGRDPVMPEAVPFSRYADEIEAFQESDAFQGVKRYWLDLFADAVPRTDLPTDRPRPLSKTYKADRLDLMLPAELVAGLKRLGTRFGSTLVTTMLSAFEVLIARKTGQLDLVVGLPAAGQSDMDMKFLVGHCVSLLPLRSRLSLDDTFSEHLGKRRTGILDAYDHQRFTLGTLLQELDVPREPGRVPLVPVVFNFDMNMDDGVSFSGLRHVYSSDPRPFEHFELSLNCSGKNDQLVLEWGYNTDLFDAATIHQWMEDLTAVVRQVCADPATPLSRLLAPGSTATARAGAERAANLPPAAWNGTVAPMPANATIWSVFAEKALGDPNKTALVQGTSEVSYGGLHAAAANVAARLIEAGVQRGDRVGILATPCPEMVMAMLGVLRAGAAYVPVDPNLPAERIASILVDAQLKRVLVTTGLAARVPIAGLAMPIVGGSDGAGIAIPPDVAITGDDAAYVIYTSGSTGKPKGVVVPHRGPVRLVDPRSFIPFGPHLTWIHNLSISFDASMLSIWGALLNGGTLAIPIDAKPSLNDLADTMLMHRVNAISTASGLFDLLVEERIDAMKGLKHLITGGDVISVRHARKVLEEVGPGVLVNAYGPTENSVVSTCFILNDARELERPLPIGKPFLNSPAYVLDEALRPVAVGERGELFTAGPGTALGYLGRPDLTAERFVMDPFTPGGGTMYRTGDLVRWLPDGNIEFLGRQDEQVKVRGFRIELGEIDAALNDLPLIGSKAIVAHAHGQGEKEILAYVTLAKENANGRSNAWIEQAVIDHLTRKLPEYMIPSAVILLDQMPLNNSGKVDKSRLPRPNRQRTQSGDATTPPATGTERTLATIWQNLLGIGSVGVHDNFFELGGHSLLGLQMFAQVEKQLGLRVQLKTLFQAPTIAQLAELIARAQPVHQLKNLIAVQPHGSRIPFFCVHGDEANHFLPRHLGSDQPFYGFAHQGEEGTPIRYRTVEALAQHLIEEMRTVRPHGPYLLGGYSFGGIVAFEMAQQLVAANEEVPVLALFDAYDPQEYRAVMKREEKAHEPLKKFLYGQLIKRLVSEEKALPHWLRHQNIMLAYDEALAQYEAVPFKGRVTLFRSKQSSGPRDMGWGYLAKGGVDVHEIDVDHFSMMKDVAISVIARELVQVIAERTQVPARQLT